LKLNPEQIQAIQYTAGPLLVLAGAGIVKTRVIINKTLYLLEQGLKPHQLMLVTFTNKAAQDVKTRIARHKDVTTLGLTVCTFHRFGLIFIRHHIEAFGMNKNFSIFDQEANISLLRGMAANTHTDLDKIKMYQSVISNWKNELLTPTQAMELAENEFDRQTALLYEQYERSLRAYNGVDFDDLIKLPVELLRKDDNIREHWQNKIRHLLVDEYQDTNLAQYDLVKLLTGRLGQFTVVGDDDQSIYAWRGARPDNLNKLQEDYPRLKVIKLEQNYRSTETILKAANHLIANNPHAFEKKIVESNGCWRQHSCANRTR